jgi:phospho-N-acetylmuramoyl-pentapeptide-transferase
MGGVVIWTSVLFTVVIFFILAHIFDSQTFSKLEFFSRNQTWIPLLALLIGSIAGLFDDFFEIMGTGSYFAGGLPLIQRLFVVAGVALFVGWWFYEKLEVHVINIPFHGSFEVGIFLIPIFIITTIAVYSGGIIDGIDGLAGGVFASIFTAYAVIAFNQQQIDLAALCATIVGGLLAFLWFNIPPARFYMSETGTMGLTIALTVIAFMTDSLGEGYGVSVLPIIAFPLMATIGSDVIQIISKKYFGRKVFKVAPLHHHFEAIGWPGAKVTMRYWVLGMIFAFIGVIIALTGRL